VSDFLARLLERGRSTIADARARGPFVTPKPRPAVEAELPTPEASPSPEDPPRVADATQPLAARPPQEREQPRRESKAPRLEPSRAEPPIAMPLAPGAEHDWRPGGPESSITRGPGTPARSAPLRDAGIRATTSASFKPQDRRRPAAPDARRGPVAIQPEQPRVDHPGPPKPVPATEDAIARWRDLGQRLLVAHPPAASRDAVANREPGRIDRDTRAAGPAPKPPAAMDAPAVASPMPEAPAQPSAQPAATKSPRAPELNTGVAAPSSRRSDVASRAPRIGQREIVIQNLEVTVFASEPARHERGAPPRTEASRRAPPSAGAWSVSARHFLGRT
jgi:hypothetical protein